MLQRAASNAYSWWWASHIRTKQSKWLDNNLEEMEDRVKSMIKLIEADADSFGKKAELYFRRRPELLTSVEETYKSYKALADRYDRISGELHKANHTIATAFPDQVQYMDDEDDDGSPKAITSIDTSRIPRPPAALPKPPAEVPKPPIDIPHFNLRNKFKEYGHSPKTPHDKKVTSQISQEKAQEEVDKLQKEILVLQTEKEFVKSSYEIGLAKYLDIEKKITELQEEVCSLHDDFGASSVIEDDEARALMAARAIKSCEETLVSLQEQQNRSTHEAKVESQRIRDAKWKLNALKSECDQPQMEPEENSDRNTELSSSSTISEAGDYVPVLKQERLELQSICDKVREHIEMSSDTSVVKLAEKIDALVEKVISLEVTVSSQTAQIQRLRLETDELQRHLRILEEDKRNLIGGSNSLSERLKQAEEELQRVQHLEKCVEDEKGVLQTHISDACHSFNDLSEILQSAKLEDQTNDTGSSTEGERKGAENGEKANSRSLVSPREGQVQACEDPGPTQGVSDDATDLQHLLLNKLEDKEKILLQEYTSILRNYKDTKQRLTEIEQKNQENHSETMTQVKELKDANAMKDNEILTLRKMLSSLQSSFNLSAQKSSVGCKDQTASTESPPSDEHIKLFQLDEPLSAIEKKFRGEIDALLEESLDFWLRFCTSYHQIQKFQTTFNGLKAEAERLKDVGAHEGSGVVASEQAVKCESVRPKDVRPHEGSVVAASEQAMKCESAPIDRKLRELNTELQVWLEKNGILKGELRCRFVSLCSIQDEISKDSRSGEAEALLFTPYEAAKFQGEVLNMQQENNKVAKELQAGLDHVKGLQGEIASTLSMLRESSELSVARNHHHHHPHPSLRHLSTKTRVPLRTFLFGSKPKKPSIFSCINPALHKQYSDMRTGGVPR